MDTKLLKTFAAVVRYNSVTRVAEELGLSQPAVSMHISRLEEQVGLELFSRINGRLRPTSAGMVFYAEVNKALGGIEHLAQPARDIRAGQLGTVTVAGHPSASITLLPEIVAKFSRQPFVGASGSHQFNFRIRQAFEGAKAELTVVADTEMFASTCGLVAGGLGCAIVDPLSARTFHGLGLEIRPFDPPVFYDIGVFHELQREPSVLATAFLEVLYAALEPFKISQESHS